MISGNFKRLVFTEIGFLIFVPPCKELINGPKCVTEFLCLPLSLEILLTCCL